MKNYIRSFIFFLGLGFSAITFADVVEYGVPITVDSNTYVVTEPAYYYYEGYRCYTKQRPDIGVNFLGLKAGVGGGNEIYCYPYP